MTLDSELVGAVVGVAVPAGGGLFLFLLKRTFTDFESKIAKLFAQMEKTLAAQQEHDARIRLIDQRLEYIERMDSFFNERCERRHAKEPAEG